MQKITDDSSVQMVYDVYELYALYEIHTLQTGAKIFKRTWTSVLYIPKLRMKRCYVIHAISDTYILCFDLHSFNIENFFSSHLFKCDWLKYALQKSLWPRRTFTTNLSADIIKNAN